MRFHHVAMAVSNIEEAYSALCAEAPVTALSDTMFDPGQSACLRLLEVGGLPVELVQDKEDGPVAGWLKRGCRLYHICYEVDDLDRTLEEAERRGSMMVSRPRSAVLFDGRRVAFVFDRICGLIEYLEKG